jgi:hypothetical protein
MKVALTDTGRRLGGLHVTIEHHIGSRSAFGANDVMSFLQFQEELRRVARFEVRPPVANPLAEAVRQIKENPAFTQSRLLSRLLTALTYERGDFRRAEASALDSATLGLVIALMNAAHAGTTARDDWVNAVSASDAAAAA